MASPKSRSIRARSLNRSQFEADIRDVAEQVVAAARRRPIGDRPHQPRSATIRARRVRNKSLDPASTVRALGCYTGTNPRRRAANRDGSSAWRWRRRHVGCSCPDDRHRGPGNGRAARARRTALHRSQPERRSRRASNSRSKADKSVTTISSALCSAAGRRLDRFGDWR